VSASFTQYTVTITQVQKLVSDFNQESESESHKEWGLGIFDKNTYAVIDSQK